VLVDARLIVYQKARIRLPYVVLVMKISLLALIKILRRSFPGEEIRISDSDEDENVWISMKVNGVTSVICFNMQEQEAFNMSSLFELALWEFVSPIA
jgi:hypothetical protein